MIHSNLRFATNRNVRCLIPPARFDFGATNPRAEDSINSEEEIKSSGEIHHYNYHTKENVVTHDFLPEKSPVNVVLTSGASCPDTLVDKVMLKLVSLFPGTRSVDEAISTYLA